MTPLKMTLTALLAVLATPAAATAYSFEVPEMEMEVFVQPDASVRVDYRIVFINRGRALDAVDVGLFHDNYAIRTMHASLDGRPLRGIARSPYVKHGVEVPLTPPLGRGERGVFEFTAVMPDMVYQDTTRDDYASLRITPTWFGPEFVRGQTDLRIAVHMLPNIEVEEVLHQGEAFSGKARYGGRVVAYWTRQTQIIGPHRVALSFPKRGLDRVVEMSSFGLLVMWFEERPESQLLSGLVIALLVGFFFFRLTGGTGWSVYVAVLGLCVFWFAHKPAHHVASWAAWPFVFGLLYWPTRRKKRVGYLPPIAHVEGGGIKRGLTAPEAAALLERPPGQLISLVIFGLLKKGILRVLVDDPLTVEVDEAFRGPRRERLSAASRRSVVLHRYEHRFLEELTAGKGVVSLIDFHAALEGLVEHAAGRLAGFDLDETRAYYRQIVERAWKEAEGIGEVEQRDRVVDQRLEWLLLDTSYQDRFSRWDRSGYRYRPVWFYAGAGSSTAAPSTGGGSSGRAGPSFRDVAASFTGRAENLASQAATSLLPGSLGAKSRGVVDLSGADSATKSFFAALAESGGSGGGGGSGCACAGCACACACAGGGR
jgi:hypothetical protein